MNGTGLILIIKISFVESTPNLNITLCPRIF